MDLSARLRNLKFGVWKVQLGSSACSIRCRSSQPARFHPLTSVWTPLLSLFYTAGPRAGEAGPERNPLWGVFGARLASFRSSPVGLYSKGVHTVQSKRVLPQTTPAESLNERCQEL